MKKMSYISLLLIALPYVLLSESCMQSDGRHANNAHPSKGYVIDVVAENLDVPWGMDFLPDGRLLFNERPGEINILDLKTGDVEALMRRNEMAGAEGGLLGLAVDPDFEKTHRVFIYETTQTENRIVRLLFIDNVLTEDSVIVKNIPKAMFHDGGILRFGPDGFLYAGTGDATNPHNAQDLQTLAGKILRMDTEGNAAAGNPFGNLIYSYGHRNVQGIAWDDEGNMYATEHGPSREISNWCCHDEINKIIPGGNYGWPHVIGSDTGARWIAPALHSGDATWAPGGLAFVKASNEEGLETTFIAACLRGSKLIAFNTSGDTASITEILFDGTYKRLRNIIAAPDGSFLFCSSNMDGREASPLANDDKIYRLQFK